MTNTFDSPNRLIVDVDDTILTTYNRDYHNSEPHTEMIDKLNRMYDEGWVIVYCTARGQLSNNGDIEKIEKNVRPILEDWMSRNGVKYHELIMGKPWGAYYIDDKAMKPDEFLSSNLEKK